MRAGNLSFQISGRVARQCPGISCLPGIGSNAVMMVNCAGFLDRSRVNGPGERAVLWVQGCPLHCRGCFNRDLWSFRVNRMVPVGDIAARVASIPGTAGITLSGGEPFCQARPLAALGRLIRDEGLTVVTFSGYPARTILRSPRRPWRDLLEATDLLVAGPYVPESAPGQGLCGSSNQRPIILSERIPAGSVQDRRGTEVEYTVRMGGEITTTGFPGMLPTPGHERCM